MIAVFVVGDAGKKLQLRQSVINSYDFDFNLKKYGFAKKQQRPTCPMRGHVLLHV